MSRNLLAVSIGNTRIRIGVFVDRKLEESLDVAIAELETVPDRLREAARFLAESQDPWLVIASVNPHLTAKITQWAEQATGLEARRIEEDLPVPVGRQIDPDTTPGEDRLLNAAAAYDVLKQACVVIDAGTAMTVDLVDGQGTFHGGAILPGASLMLRSLREHTAQLPEVSLQKPLEPVGHNTAEAMRTGVYHAIRGAMRELVEQYAQVLGTFPLVVVTGGDAALLLADHELVDRYAPDLTLQGIALAAATAEAEADAE